MSLNNDNESNLELISSDIKIGFDRLTRFERARIIGARALQLSMGAPILVEIENVENKSPLVIAEIELQGKVLPVSIRRSLPDKTYQMIALQKLKDIQALREI